MAAPQLAMITDSHGTAFLIDVALDENHEFQAEITDDPIEDGSTISDNIRNRPPVVTMECIVSDTPINSEIIDARSGLVSPSTEAYQFLTKCRDDREPISIRTSLDTFDSMGIENLGIPRKTGRGAELRFTLAVKKMTIVKNTRVTRAEPIATPTKTKIKPTIPFATSGNIAICTVTHRWLDPQINGWRKFALPGSAGPAVVLGGDPRTLPGFWTLIRGAPDGLSVKAWSNLSQQSKRAQEQILAQEHTDSKPFADEETQQSLFPASRNVIVVPAVSCVLRDDG